MATRERTTKRARREVPARAERAERAAETVERPRVIERPAPAPTLSPAALYRAEKARRSAQMPSTQALEEAKREFEQMLRESRPAGTGGRPKKKPAAPADEIELDDLDGPIPVVPDDE